MVSVPGVLPWTIVVSMPGVLPWTIVVSMLGVTMDHSGLHA